MTAAAGGTSKGWGGHAHALLGTAGTPCTEAGESTRHGAAAKGDIVAAVRFGTAARLCTEVGESMRVAVAARTRFDSSPCGVAEWREGAVAVRQGTALGSAVEEVKASAGRLSSAACVKQVNTVVVKKWREYVSEVRRKDWEGTWA